ncbi:DUF302 domain-containing protein [Rubrivirga sp. S365]|uniref:DUF302 domain-containing protein n=1 Tax=Rubrivirga litoralis TaxID=3075598 RepID=A0ABU3BU55_9BACT|nr:MULTISPECIES: DUF302 domain-containing protein [unclassified Rubrivirga]MDT0632816.1 DUF302 domain-containing protein [Rubrivirga sp. F394]MDT7855094.1 DUF302 domain-containing protein [Rubrivirga sp. S365]
MPFRLLLVLPLLAGLFAVAAGCDTDDGEDADLPDRPGLAVAESDAGVATSFGRLTDALDAAPPVSIVARVDHAANAASAGLDLRPTRVVLFGNPALGTPLMQVNQQAGLDLPQKVLVFEDAEGQTVVGYNTTDYLAQRHGVGGAETLGRIAGALATFAGVAAGDSTVNVEVGGGPVSRDEGVVTATSANDVGATYAGLVSAIESNPNLTVMAELDHAANAASVGLELRPTRLVVFGNPALGTPLMQDEQTVGIDLPQKMLVYEDAAGRVVVAYNDPGYLAERHDLDDSDEVIDRVRGALRALAAAAVSGDTND